MLGRVLMGWFQLKLRFAEFLIDGNVGHTPSPLLRLRPLPLVRHEPLHHHQEK